jgi:uncharacterized protein YdhG (YjbR/CyaY superfamily)
MNKPANIDEYITTFPPEVQTILNLMRETVKKAAPNAEEAISYGMPLYKLQGRLVYFGAHTHHMGLYPMGAAIEHFKKELSIYKGAKGSVQFPYDKPLPVDLITSIVKFRVAQNLEKATMKKKK